MNDFNLGYLDAHANHTHLPVGALITRNWPPNRYQDASSMQHRTWLGGIMAYLRDTIPVEKRTTADPRWRLSRTSPPWRLI